LVVHLVSSGYNEISPLLASTGKNLYGYPWKNPLLASLKKSFRRPCPSTYAANSSGHRLIWWEGMRCRFAMNPMLHRTILRKSITFAYVDLRENKSKLG